MAVTLRDQRAAPTDGRQVLSNLGIGRHSYCRISTVLEMPNLVQLQMDSFDWFKTEGLRELLEEISPIVDYNGKMELHFLEHRFDEPRASEETCRERDMTYAAPLRIRVRLVIRETGEIKESDVFLGDFPMMTPDGTFLINGAERVVVSQLVRSPGVYFELSDDPTTGRPLCSAKLIPSRGAWLEFETSNRNVLSVKVDRKRKLPATILLRAIGFAEDDEIRELFSEVRRSRASLSLTARSSAIRRAASRRRRSSSIADCDLATRRPRTTRHRFLRDCSSIRGVTTWLAWAATS